MRLLLLGYGKMGRLIDRLATEKGHEIAGRISLENRAELETLDGSAVDVALDFSQPDAVVPNIKWCIDRQIPVVVGTTGWLDRKSEVDAYCLKNRGTYLYASNFSIGMNLFFRVNALLARLMNGRKSYDISMKETHHTHKRDTPSGTALTLAQGILARIERKEKWVSGPTTDPEALAIISERVDPTPGTHSIHYDSPVDSIEIKHTAHSREGFATGALLVAEWIPGRTGILSMENFLGF